jgi:hypothetical protein
MRSRELPNAPAIPEQELRRGEKRGNDEESEYADRERYRAE